MKHNVPYVIAPQENSIINTLEHYAISNKSPLYREGIEWSCKKKNKKWFLNQLFNQ